MDFTNLKSLTIPEGEVKSITANGVVLWEAISYTNQIPLSIGTDKKTYNNGQGWKTGYRLNSSGVEASMTDWEVTGFIPINATADMLRFKNCQWRGGSSPNNDYVAFFDANFKMLTSTKLISEWISSNGSSVASTRGITQDANGNITSIDMSKFKNGGFGSMNASSWANAKYVRFSMYGITNNSIITINQPIT